MDFIFALPNLLIAQAFIITAYFDIRPANKAMIITKLREQGIPLPDKAIWAGLLLKTLAGFGLLFAATVHLSAYALIIFTAIATFIFAPFWKKTGPERDMAIAQFCTCVAVIGGLCALI